MLVSKDTLLPSAREVELQEELKSVETENESLKKKI